MLLSMNSISCSYEYSPKYNNEYPSVEKALGKLDSFERLSFDEEDLLKEYLSSCLFDKNTPFQTSLHYSERTYKIERTVFGKAHKGLFYNYSDRLLGDGWSAGVVSAKSLGLVPQSAAFFEEVLRVFHGAAQLDLQHVILGCNPSNGHSYLIFGYKYWN